MKKNTLIISSLLGFYSLLFCVTNVQASISVDFGNFTGVDYNNGEPTPMDVVATFNIVNEESTPLTVLTLTIDSVSMGFDLVTDGDWSCGYTETQAAPNFERITTCVPNNALVIAPGDSSSLDLSFIFENTSNEGITHPDEVRFKNVVLNGNTVNPANADLGGFDWHITAIDENQPSPPSPTEKTGEVRGYVYFDDNHNDKKDGGEEGVEDVRMKLHYAGNDGKFDNGDDKKYSTRTNKYGKYRFNHLLSGRYRLKIKDGQMQEFYLTAEKDKLNGKSHFKLKEGETKERDFGYDRDKDSEGNPKNNNLHYLQSGFVFSVTEMFRLLFGLVVK